jgi:hypothetical protein
MTIATTQNDVATTTTILSACNLSDPWLLLSSEAAKAISARRHAQEAVA